METMRYKILTFLLVISTVSTFAQTKKLIETFKFGAVGFSLYSQNGKPNSGLVDTSFYLLYRVGSTKTIAKEIKEITEKLVAIFDFKLVISSLLNQYSLNETVLQMMRTGSILKTARGFCRLKSMAYQQ